MPTPEGQITSTETWMTPAQVEEVQQAQTEEPEGEYVVEETDTESSDN